MMSLLAGHAILELEYEELSASLQSELDRILDFLGLDRLALRPRTLRQGTDDLRSAIENYDELHDQLAGTVAAEWLVSDSDGL